jgi:hypothetical protein
MINCNGNYNFHAKIKFQMVKKYYGLSGDGTIFAALYGIV